MVQKNIWCNLPGVVYHEVMNKHTEWLNRSTGDSVHAVAMRMGVDPSNFSKKVKKGLAAEEIISICYKYDLDPIAALYDTDVLDRDKAQPVKPEEVASRIRQDLDALERIATHEFEQSANVLELPVRQPPYDDNMPEDAAAYGEELFDTHDDDDH